MDENQEFQEEPRHGSPQEVSTEVDPAAHSVVKAPAAIELPASDLPAEFTESDRQISSFADENEPLDGTPIEYSAPYTGAFSAESPGNYEPPGELTPEFTPSFDEPAQVIEAWPDQPTREDEWAAQTSPEQRLTAQKPFELPFVPVRYTPETPAETVRQTGLAYTVGIVFFVTVAFMLFLGWLADLLLGTSPWGIVFGIILGSVIGFVQFFRISSQIHAPKKDASRPLLSDDDNVRPL